jgi:hydrogenase-1 operon protein HyaF
MRKEEAMNDFPIPVRMVGPGTQPADEEALQYIAMPHEMSTFRMPDVPARADGAALACARDVLAQFLRLVGDWNPAAEPAGPAVDLADVSADVLTLVNQMMGEGEVSIRIAGAPEYRIQESVFTGLWRVCAFDADGRQTADRLEAGALPRVVPAAARAAASPRLADVALPPGAMNSPALLAEIAAQMRERTSGAGAHVVNLTLFPMTPEDHAVLASALPAGPVAIISRGFGNCRVASTLARDVWRVQYYNSVNTLILNTLEIVDVPEVALAAVEDLEDSRTRLAELVEWMAESNAA